MAVDAVSEKLAVFNSPALEPDLEAMGACTGKVDASDRVVRILLSLQGHKV